jgi:hypothetical protein
VRERQRLADRRPACQRSEASEGAAWCDDERGAGGIPAPAAEQAPSRVW